MKTHSIDYDETGFLVFAINNYQSSVINNWTVLGFEPYTESFSILYTHQAYTIKARYAG